MEGWGAKQFFSIEELVKRWGLSRWTITRWADAKLIETKKFGSRRLVPVSEVVRVESVGLPSPRKPKDDAPPASGPTAAAQ